MSKSDHEYIEATVTLPMPGDDSQTVDYKCHFDFNYHKGTEGNMDGDPDGRYEPISEEIEITRLRLEITDFVWTSAFHIFDFKTVDVNIPHFISVEDQLEEAVKHYLDKLKEAKKERDTDAQIVAHQQDNNL